MRSRLSLARGGSAALAAWRFLDRRVAPFVPWLTFEPLLVGDKARADPRQQR